MNLRDSMLLAFGTGVAKPYIQGSHGSVTRSPYVLIRKHAAQGWSPSISNAEGREEGGA